MTICEGGSGRFRACRFKTEESIKTAGAQQNSLLNSGHHKYGILAFCTELSDLSDLYAELASPPLLIQTNLRTWKQASLLTAELSRDYARLTFFCIYTLIVNHTTTYNTGASTYPITKIKREKKQQQQLLLITTVISFTTLKQLLTLLTLF